MKYLLYRHTTTGIVHSGTKLPTSAQNSHYFSAALPRPRIHNIKLRCHPGPAYCVTLMLLGPTTLPENLVGVTSRHIKIEHLIRTRTIYLNPLPRLPYSCLRSCDIVTVLVAIRKVVNGLYH